ncbi:MAG: response regulator transcription factor [Deltaproteobacteria bacterium]|nr:response regulator transcription factor [Deltaproteobacteria bacterium]
MIVKLLLADDHRLVREGVRRLVEEVPELRVVAEAATGEEAVELATLHEPDIAVLELTMPRLSGVEAIRRIRQRGLRTRCLVLSIHDGQLQVTQALQAGAAGYLVKSCSPAELRDAIAALAAGRTYLSPSIADRVVGALVQPGEAASPVSLLTGREREVLQLIAEGLSSKEIATALGVSIKTVETHRCNLMAKLKIRKASRLVRVAIHEGLVAL